MTRRLILLAVALSLTTVAVTPVASADGCQEPADGVAVCDTDADDQPDLVTAGASAEGAGSASVTARNYDGEFFSQRGVWAEANSAEGSPVGANAAAAQAGCSAGFGDDAPCTGGGASVAAEDDVDSGVVVGAGCSGAVGGLTPACSYLSASVDARHDGQGARVVYICGAVGFFGPPCPVDHSVGAFVDTDQGDATAFGGYTAPANVGACENDPVTGFTCLP